MGCGLRKLKPVSEDNSPGKIYSTLKRPQVETKVGTAYSYRYLDFLIGKDGGTSTLRLSSVRELPGQLQDLYQQGFVLAALHPFIHPCGPESNSPQHQLYRAILVRLSDGVDRGQCRLQLEDCLSADQVPTPELVQGYVKKQIQDAADQGVLFVGFIQEPYGAPSRTREPHTPSLSLHSSPSSVLGSLCSSSSPSDPSSPVRGNTDDSTPCLSEEEQQRFVSGTEDSSPSLCHNNNTAAGPQTKDRPQYRQRRPDGVELLALYNHPPVREVQVKYYTVKVPLKVQNSEDGVKGVEANWLDHMTQHFNNGASLVDGYFHLGDVNDLSPRTVESVFIFQEASEGEANSQAYDAIVVEQWTVIDGLQVKADYVPLLQSLASFGWKLTCVLPTPVVRTNSDGSLSTKQIVFLQRPVLSRKKRESKKLIFKARGKSNKNCIKETTKNKQKGNKADKDVNDGKSGDGQSAAKEKERVDTAEVETTEREKDEKREPRIETDQMKVTEEAVEGVAQEKGVSVAVAETETKEEEVGPEEVRAVMENGLETDPEDHLTDVEIVPKKAVKERATAAN